MTVESRVAAELCVALRTLDGRHASVFRLWRRFVAILDDELLLRLRFLLQRADQWGYDAIGDKRSNATSLLEQKDFAIVNASFLAIDKIRLSWKFGFRSLHLNFHLNSNFSSGFLSSESFDLGNLSGDDVVKDGFFEDGVVVGDVFDNCDFGAAVSV